MGELINGKTPEQVKRILKWISSECGNRDCDHCQYNDICSPQNGRDDIVARDALALIERLEAERDAALAKVPKWISVEERLPEDDGDYVALISLKRYKPRFVARVYYKKPVGFHWRTGKITHWMPMLELPKEDVYG